MRPAESRLRVSINTSNSRILSFTETWHGGVLALLEICQRLGQDDAFPRLVSPVSDPGTGWLDEKDILAAHALLQLGKDILIVKLADGDLAQRFVQAIGDLLGQGWV